MGFVEVLLLGAGLAMDAFAVSICKGLGMRRIIVAHALAIALAFGVFQAGMPLIGWVLGSAFSSYVTPVDHWIAFALLAFIGGKMLWDAFHEDDDVEAKDSDRLDVKELLMLAIATSIDALAVGITFAFLDVNVGSAVASIGIVTFLLSLVGVVVGNVFGARFERKATIAGGIVLIAIGTKILLEHLGLLVL